MENDLVFLVSKDLNTVVSLPKKDWDEVKKDVRSVALVNQRRNGATGSIYYKSNTLREEFSVATIEHVASLRSKGHNFHVNDPFVTFVESQVQPAVPATPTKPESTASVLPTCYLFERNGEIHTTLPVVWDRKSTSVEVDTISLNKVTGKTKKHIGLVVDLTKAEVLTKATTLLCEGVSVKFPTASGVIPYPKGTKFLRQNGVVATLVDIVVTDPSNPAYILRDGFNNQTLVTHNTLSAKWGELSVRRLLEISQRVKYKGNRTFVFEGLSESICLTVSPVVATHIFMELRETWQEHAVFLKHRHTGEEVIAFSSDALGFYGETIILKSTGNEGTKQGYSEVIASTVEKSLLATDWIPSPTQYVHVRAVASNSEESVLLTGDSKNYLKAITRDLRPNAVWIDPQGNIKVIDKVSEEYVRYVVKEKGEPSLFSLKYFLGHYRPVTALDCLLDEKLDATVKPLRASNTIGDEVDYLAGKLLAIRDRNGVCYACSTSRGEAVLFFKGRSKVFDIFGIDTNGDISGYCGFEEQVKLFHRELSPYFKKEGEASFSTPGIDFKFHQATKSGDQTVEVFSSKSKVAVPCVGFQSFEEFLHFDLDTINGHKKNAGALATEPVAVPSKDETLAVSSAYKVAATQLTRLSSVPLEALLAKHITGLDPDKTKAFLRSEAGRALVMALVATGVSLEPTLHNKRLAQELRVLAMTQAGMVVSDVVLEPVMKALTEALKGTSTPPALPPASSPGGYHSMVGQGEIKSKVAGLAGRTTRCDTTRMLRELSRSTG